MVITAITLENFKGIKGPCRIKMRPLTMLFGANSAGKSSVVQGLHYAREIFMRHNTDPDKTLLGGSMDLGGFSSFVFNHDQSLPIRITFDLDLSTNPLPDYYDDNDTRYWEWEQNELKEAVGRVESASVSIAVQVIEEDRLSPFAGQAAITAYEVKVNGEGLAKLELVPGNEQVRLTLNPVNSIYWQDIKDRARFARTVKAAFEGTEFDEDKSELDEGALLKYLLINTEDDDEQDNDDSFSLSEGKILRDMKSPFPLWGRMLPLVDTFEFINQGGGDDDPLKVPSLIVSSCLTSLITGPGEMIRNDLERMCYLGPIREVPQRNNVEVKSPDLSRWANGLAAWDALYSQGEELIKKTNHWLASDERLDSGYRVEMEVFRKLNENGRLMAAIRSERSLDAYQEELDEIRAQKPEKRLYLLEEAKNIKVLPQDIGVGISQMLPVVVSSLVAGNTILAIEQPELHIHPKLQVRLGDLFIQEGTRNGNCFIIETHSEHLMLRILRRIRETADKELPPGISGLTSDQIAVYHVESREEGCVFHHIRIDEDGDFLDRWPDGFFEERDEEL
jgi:hypothetical protein